MSSSSSSSSVSSSESIIKSYESINKKYTSNGQDALKRHWSYLASSGLVSEPAVTLTTAVAYGVVGGVLAGNYAARNISDKLKLKDQAKDITIITGMSIGGVGGGLTGVYAHMAITETRSKKYKTWRAEIIQKEIFEELETAHPSDFVLSQFGCGISMGCMLDPVISPHGHVYERSQILKCDRTKEGMIKDPKRNEPFSEQDLLPWHELGIVMKKRAILLLSSDNKILNKKDALMKNGVSSCIDTLQELVIKDYKEAKRAIESKFESMKIDRHQYMQKLNEFLDLFGETPKWFVHKDLNWNRKWDSILFSRLEGKNAVESLQGGNRIIFANELPVFSEDGKDEYRPIFPINQNMNETVN